MLNRMKVSFLVIAAIALFFGASWMIGESFDEIVKAQEPSTVETVQQEAVFNEVDFTAPATSDTVNETVFNEVDIIAPAMPVGTGSGLTELESTDLKPVADTVDDAVLPAVPENTGAELTRWESLNLKSPADSVDYAGPATSVNPDSDLSMWERLNFLAPFSSN